jgi:hypothetical protein
MHILILFTLLLLWNTTAHLNAGIPDSMTIYWNKDGYTQKDPPGEKLTLPQDEERLLHLLETSEDGSARYVTRLQFWGCYCSFVTFPQTTDPDIAQKAEQALAKLTLEDIPGYMHPIFHGIVGNEIIAFEEVCKQDPTISWWDVEARMDYNRETERFEILKDKPTTPPPLLSTFFPKSWTWPLGAEDYPQAHQAVRVIGYRVGNRLTDMHLDMARVNHHPAIPYRVGNRPADSPQYPVLIWFLDVEYNYYYWLVTIPLTLE